MVEVERKYKVLYLPENLGDYEYKDIEQSYLNFGSKPAVRLRMINDEEFILCCKRKKENLDGPQICDEFELPLSKEAYLHLKDKIDGRVLSKRRYIIPIEDGLKVELDLFKDFYEGVAFAEIEFKSEEQANSYISPKWLGEDISDDDRVANGYMAVKASSIEEYNDLLVK